MGFEDKGMRYIVVHRGDYLRHEEKEEIIRLFGPSLTSGEVEDIIFFEGSDRYSVEVFDTKFVTEPLYGRDMN